MSIDIKKIEFIETELKNNHNINLKRFVLQGSKSAKGIVIDSNRNVIALFLNSANLKKIPEFIFQLDNLVELELLNNNIKNIPQEIYRLNKLKQLSLANNKIQSIPESITELKDLTHLNLESNLFDQFPIELCTLNNLRFLNFRKNNLVRIPNEIYTLKNLISLNFELNRIEELPIDIGKLSNLRELSVSKNKIINLPKSIIKLENLTELKLEGNPLDQIPPEILDQGLMAITEYLRQLPEIETRIQNEAKLILVGQGTVGKTSLAQRLINDMFYELKSTEGIDISRWEFQSAINDKEKIKLNVWDFGGQEIYHATHQFFLTKRSIYLLVWNARKSRDYDNIYYWLHTIEAFGENSPILLVMSKCEERDDDLNIKDLKENFPQIIGVCKVDSKTGKGISRLKKQIDEISWKLPHMQTLWIESWLKIRNILENDTRNWITYSEYVKICETEGLNNRQADILDEYLHDLGVIIHFRDRLALSNMVILKPEWATDAVYKVLDSQTVRDREGILKYSDLIDIWDTEIYPQSIFPQLLELMKRFELSYEILGKESHLVAELLPSIEPEFEWDYEKNLCFYIRFDFLPAGVMTRFIVLVHQDLKLVDNKYLCWREGAVLVRENTSALVKVKPLERVIEIRIIGDTKRDLLSIIRHFFNHITNSINKVKIVEEIPCNCSTDCRYIFNYKRLIQAERSNRKYIDCQETWQQVALSKLLDGYEDKEQRMSNKKKSVKYLSPQYIDQSTYIFGNIENSAIMTHSNESKQNVNSLKELIPFFESMKPIIQYDSLLTDEQKEEILTDIESLRMEISKVKPRQNVIETYLSNLGNIASIAGLVQQIYPFLPLLIK